MNDSVNIGIVRYMRKRVKPTAHEKAVRKIIRKRRWMKLGIVFMVVMLLGYMAGGAAALGVVYSMMKDAPEMEVADFISQESTKIYDAEGHIIAEVGTYLRDNISYNDCPEALVDAFLSIEDSRFFSHNGFDIPRFMKAALTNLSNGDLGSGGSTFTMQLVKNTYFSVEDGETDTTRTRSISYKVQQIMLSMEAETVLSKKQVFELYANKLNFGRNIRGVERASQYYFGKDARELNLSEAALIAGIVNLPNLYNPYDYLDYATQRRNEVLRLMVNHGYISEDEYVLAKGIKVEDQLVGQYYDSHTGEDKYLAYIDAVIAEAEKMTGLDPSIKGMEIYTAMEPKIQQCIEDIEQEKTSVWFADDLMQVGIISMNNKTGEIVGIGGGRHYTGGRAYNRATDGFKQPGSSVKPILSYALGFEYLGFSLDEVLEDRPITLPYESRVLVNANGTYAGDVTLKMAVALSLNIPAILTLEDVVEKAGRETVVKYLQSLGFSRVTEDNFEYLFAIGGNEFMTTPRELAGAHAAIANNGVYNQPHTIKYITTTVGDTYYPENQNKRVISSGSAWLVLQLMRNNVEADVGNYMEILARQYPVYAKTGTTDWGDSGISYGIPEGASKDKWMVSETSQYTNAVWVGWDKAVAWAGTYFANWKSYLNIPGKINKLLLDAEEEVSPDTVWGVERPSDVQDVRFVYGTYPHVAVEGWMPGGSLITSQISTTGLKNSPLVSASEYSNGKPNLKGITATLKKGGVRIVWNTNMSSCTGSTRDISLHDEWNDIPATGACLVNNGWLAGGASGNFVATIYQDGVYVTSISSRTGQAEVDLSSTDGKIRVCGSYSNASGSSREACAYAGWADGEKPEEDDEDKDKEKDDEVVDDAPSIDDPVDTPEPPKPTPEPTPEPTPVPTPEPPTDPVVPPNPEENGTGGDSGN